MIMSRLDDAMDGGGGRKEHASTAAAGDNDDDARKNVAERRAFVVNQIVPENFAVTSQPPLQPLLPHHISGSVAESSFVKRLSVEQVGMLHKIFEMEGAYPVSAPTLSLPGAPPPVAGGASSSMRSGTLTADTSVGALCLTVPRFVEALTFVSTRVGDGARGLSDHLVVHVRKEAQAWAQQLACQVESLRPRRPTTNSRGGTAEGLPLMTPTSASRGKMSSSNGMAGGSLLFTPDQPDNTRDSSPFHVVSDDLSALFAFTSSSANAQLPSGYGPAQSSSSSSSYANLHSLFTPGEPKLVVKWSDVTSSFIREVKHNDAVEDQDHDVQRISKGIVKCTLSKMHATCPSMCLLSTATGEGKLVTGGTDGLIKVWNSATCDFESNLSNNGNAWVIGMAFLQNENYLMVATSNGQLTVYEFPSGTVVQKYLGCLSLDSAVSEVNVRSVLHTQKYGMTPGESGPRQVHFTNVAELTQEVFTERRRTARGGQLSHNVTVKPIVGFVEPTVLEYLPQHSLCVFGTISGVVGCFDITEDLRQATLITGSAVRSINVLFSTSAHLDAVTAIRYSKKMALLITCGMDGCIYKISMEGANWMALATPQRHNVIEATSSRPMMGMEWTEQLQILVTWSSDRLVRFWSMMRPEPLHTMDTFAHDVLSVTFMGNERVVILTSDKTIYLYDLKAFRLLQTITQSITNENSGGALDVSSLTVVKSAGDHSGCITYDASRQVIVCCLRSPVQYGGANSLYAATAGRSSAGLLSRSPQSVRRAAAGRSVAPSLENTNGTADGQPVAQSNLLSTTMPMLSSPPPSAAPSFHQPSLLSPSSRAVLMTVAQMSSTRHSLPVLDLSVDRHTRQLFSIDEDNVVLWDVTSGECLASTNVSRQLQKIPSTPSKSLVVQTRCGVSSGGAAGSETTRLVTGTQNGFLLTWNATATSILSIECLGATASANSVNIPDVACIADAGVHSVAVVGSRACFIPRDATMSSTETVVKKSNCSSSSVRSCIDVPGGVSITSARMLRDAIILLGTVDGTLHIGTFDTGAIIQSIRLTDRDGRDEVKSIEEILVLNRRKQNVALLLLEDGSLEVFDATKRMVVFHARVFRRHESRLCSAALSTHDELLYVGDSIGRVFVFDVSSLSSATTEWRQSIRFLYSVQAAVGAISSMVAVDGSSSSGSYHNNNNNNNNTSGGDETNAATPGCEFLIVACLSSPSLRLFSTCRSGAVHVGSFGEGSLWDWRHNETFAREELPAAEKESIDPEGEQYLDTILRTARLHSDEALQKQKQQQQQQSLSSSTGMMPKCMTQQPSSLSPPQQQQQQQQRCMPRGDNKPIIGPVALQAVSPRRRSVNLDGTLSGVPLLLPNSDVCVPSPPLTAPAGSGGRGTSLLLLNASQKLHVKRRYIRAPDIDLGNGQHLSDHHHAHQHSSSGPPSMSATAAAGGSPQRPPTSSVFHDDNITESTSASVHRTSTISNPSGGAGDECGGDVDHASNVFLTSIPAEPWTTSSRLNQNSTLALLPSSVAAASATGQNDDAPQQQHVGMSVSPTSPASISGCGAVAAGGPPSSSLLPPVPLGDSVLNLNTLVVPTTTRSLATNSNNNNSESAVPPPLPDMTSCNSNTNTRQQSLASSFIAPQRSLTVAHTSAEDAAREHTRQLLVQMALRLDSVQPQGSSVGGFQRRVERLYETEEEKQKRRKLRREQQRMSSISGTSTTEAEEEDVLATLRSPQTVKNMQDLEEKLRQYKRNREFGGVIATAPLPPPLTTNVTGGGSSASGSGGGPAGGNGASASARSFKQRTKDPQWTTRVSSQLFVEDVHFTIPSTIASAMMPKTNQKASMMATMMGGGSGGGNAGTLQRGMSLFAPAPPATSHRARHR